MRGRILYFGNPTRGWSLAQWDAAFAQSQQWGFDGVAPKVGESGVTWFGSDAALRAIVSHAAAHRLTCWPWVYSYPASLKRDAAICSEIAHAVGLAFVDVEQPEDMVAFVQEYKRATPEDLPLLVTTAGDPVTWRTGWPGPSLIQSGAVPSPQWYVGEWMKGNYCHDVVGCVNKASALS